MKPITCAVVGARQGLENVYVVLNHPRFRLVSVCDLDEEPYRWVTGKTLFEESADQYAGATHLRPMVRAIRKHPDASSIGYTADVDEVLRDDSIDAVILVVPDALHEVIAPRALEAGKYVLLTKPISNTLGGAATVLKAARRAADRFMLGFQVSYSRFATEVKRLIDEGTVGEVRQITYQFHRPQFFRPFNRLKARSGGALIQEGCHYFDLFYRFTGSRFTALTGAGGLDLHRETQDIQDNGVILVETASSVRCVFLFSYFRGNRLRDTITITGTEGSIAGSIDGVEWEHAERNGRLEFENHRLPHLSHEGYYEMHDAFAGMIDSGLPPYADYRTSMENVLTSHGAQRALDTGAWVTRDDMLTELGLPDDVPGSGS